MKADTHPDYHFINVVMTDLPKPSSIRRTVCFSEAVYRGETKVEEVHARLAADAADALRLLEENILPVIVDPKAESAKELHPDVIVDAILAASGSSVFLLDTVRSPDRLDLTIDDASWSGHRVATSAKK